ncbi:unnamed protein product [Ilex paraguariensis]|uniref:Uncharacterized protein n=1 Tax=Ilex paraguariensis TaxID=185542 RepID=A0ABC8U9B7_9AQUA
MLKPQEKEIAKPGSMCYMPGSVVLEHVFPPEHEAGMWQWLFGKRVTSIVFSNVGPSDGFVGIAAPSLARILPVSIVHFFLSTIDLAVLGGEMFQDAFLCSISDVKVSNVVDQRVRNVIATAEFLEAEDFWPGACIYCRGWYRYDILTSCKFQETLQCRFEECESCLSIEDNVFRTKNCLFS